MLCGSNLEEVMKWWVECALKERGNNTSGLGVVCLCFLACVQECALVQHYYGLQRGI